MNTSGSSGEMAESPWIEKYCLGDDTVCVRSVKGYFSFQVNYNDGVSIAHETGYMTEDRAIRAGKNKLKNLNAQSHLRFDKRLKH